MKQKKEKRIKAWAVICQPVGIEWSDGNECFAIYKNRKNAAKRKLEASDVYEVVPCTITYKLPQ